MPSVHTLYFYSHTTVANRFLSEHCFLCRHRKTSDFRSVLSFRSCVCLLNQGFAEICRYLLFLLLFLVFSLIKRVLFGKKTNFSPSSFVSSAFFLLRKSGFMRLTDLPLFVKRSESYISLLGSCISFIIEIRRMLMNSCYRP